MFEKRDVTSGQLDVWLWKRQQAEIEADIGGDIHISYKYAFIFMENETIENFEIFCSRQEASLHN